MLGCYESGGRRQEHWEVAAEEFGELRNGAEEQENKLSPRITEFTVFALRGSGCCKVDLGRWYFGKDLGETPKRQADVAKRIDVPEGNTGAFD